MTTPILVTGWEHGVATPTVNGEGICVTITGSPEVVSTTKRSGSYALQTKATSAAVTRISYNFANPTIAVARFYFRYAVAPSGDVAIFRAGTAAGNAPKIMFIAADNTLCGQVSSNGNKTAPLSADTWYRIDCRFNVADTGTTKVDLQLDGSAVTQLSFTQTDTTMAGAYIGLYSAVTGELYFDDLIISTTSADYPIGAGAVEALLPSGEGTHNAGTNVIEDQAGADIGVVTAYNLLNDIPISTATNYIRQYATGTGNYAEVEFADTSNTVIQGVGALLAYMASGTTSDNGGCVIIDEDATATTVWGGAGSSQADYSESSMFYKYKQLPVPSGGWDQGAVNALKARMGYSSNVTTNPYWENLILEVAYGPRTESSSVSPSISPSRSLSPSSSISPSISPSTVNFPTVGILDDFNRADNPTLGLNWISNTGLEISSNQLSSTTAITYPSAIWNQTFGPAFEGYITATVAETDPGNTAVLTYWYDYGVDQGYFLQVTYSNEYFNITFNRASDYSQPFTWGDPVPVGVGDTFSVGVRHLSDGDYSIYYKKNTGSWQELAQGNDSVDLVEGTILIALGYGEYLDGPFYVDNFGGGTYSALISGSTCWGHITGVTESNTRTFVSNWTGTGTVVGSGNAEVVQLTSGQYMESEVVRTPAANVTLSQNKYDSGDTIRVRYRQGSSEANCLAAGWTTYTVPFSSTGYAQIRIESTL